jgi:3-dehydroquinate dehydratase-2
MVKHILIINGPNLNLLGTRQPEVYGHDTLETIEAACIKLASQLRLEVDFRQSNNEGEIVNWIQDSRISHAGLVINAGAYTHTSVAILDALLAVDSPVIEVHLSNIYQRDEFRQNSYVSKAALGVICGLGAHGYELALEALARHLASAPGAGKGSN